MPRDARNVSQEIEIERAAGLYATEQAREETTQAFLQLQLQEVQTQLQSRQAENASIQQDISSFRSDAPTSPHIEIEQAAPPLSPGVTRWQEASMQHTEAEQAVQAAREARDLVLRDLKSARFELDAVKIQHSELQSRLKDCQDNSSKQHLQSGSSQTGAPRGGLQAQDLLLNNELQLQQETSRLSTERDAMAKRLQDIEQQLRLRCCSLMQRQDVKEVLNDFQGALQGHFTAVRQGALDVELHRRLSVAQEDAANERSRNAALLQQLAEQRQLLRIAQLDCSSFESEAEQMGREAVRGRSERKDLERRVEALKDQLWVLRQPRDQQRQESNYTMQRTHYSHSTTVVQRPHYSGEAGQVLAEQLIAAVQDQPRQPRTVPWIPGSNFQAQSDLSAIVNAQRGTVQCKPSPNQHSFHDGNHRSQVSAADALSRMHARLCELGE